MEKISIIIPIYNATEFLDKCLGSVINQTYKNIEIICVNDGSKDDSLEILRKYEKKDNRIVIIDKKNAGVSAARNDGIRKSTGEYITFVDADDWLEANTIEILYNTLIEQNVDVVRGNYYLNIDSENYESTGSLAGLENKKLLTVQEDFVDLVMEKLLDARLLCYVWLLLIKREYVMKTTLFREDTLLMEDTIFYNELMDKINSIYFLDVPLYHYYCNPDSCTKSNEYYVRNVNNLIISNRHLREEIKKDSFAKERSRIDIINTYTTNTIANYLFIMYLYSLKSEEELIELIEELISKEDFCNVFNSANLNLLPIHLVIPIKLILKRRYKILLLYYRIRKILKRIKES